MKLSTLPILVACVFAFCVVLAQRAKQHQAITRAEARSVYLLLVALFVWTLTAAVLGIQGIHASPWLQERVPLLWQATVPVLIVAVGLLLSRTLRGALRGVASGTPWHWLVFFQGLRMGALGGVVKGLKGEVTSGFVFWVGIPDFLFGLSAPIVGWLLLRKAISHHVLMLWNLIGAAIILIPTFVFMPHFMSEPGFIFIFEFPMVLAPSIVVPIFVLLNVLLAWRLFELGKERAMS